MTPVDVNYKPLTRVDRFKNHLINIHNSLVDNKIEDYKTNGFTDELMSDFLKMNKDKIDNQVIPFLLGEYPEFDEIFDLSKGIYSDNNLSELNALLEDDGTAYGKSRDDLLNAMLNEDNEFDSYIDNVLKNDKKEFVDTVSFHNYYFFQALNPGNSALKEDDKLPNRI
ncbi:MAG: hypothetical protein HRT47_03340 [Candidatus Caenarcaniphilales bacterium]|nr:hypothetical protein [Candidatus Caenarcaniphilales bacterium]